MKFLKKDASEGNYVSDVVLRQALAHPEISFRFVKDGRGNQPAAEKHREDDARHQDFAKRQRSRREDVRPYRRHEKLKESAENRHCRGDEKRLRNHFRRKNITIRVECEMPGNDEEIGFRDVLIGSERGEKGLQERVQRDQSQKSQNNAVDVIESSSFSVIHRFPPPSVF